MIWWLWSFFMSCFRLILIIIILILTVTSFISKLLLFWDLLISKLLVIVCVHIISLGVLRILLLKICSEIRLKLDSRQVRWIILHVSIIAIVSIYFIIIYKHISEIFEYYLDCELLMQFDAFRMTFCYVFNFVPID